MSQTAMATMPALKGPSMWPVIFAPLVALVYYLALKVAFIYSLNFAVGGAGPETPIARFSDIRWGTHWIYHIVAEAVSIGVAVYVASGLARGRERVAGLTAAMAISLLLAAPIAWFFWLMMDAHSLKFSQIEYREPLYQFAIEGAAIVGAPVWSRSISDIVRESNGGNRTGFDGINRLHFLWLWIPLLMYAMNIISPMTHYYTTLFQNGFGFRTIFAAWFVALPLACALIPMSTGLRLLSNRSSMKLPPVIRNLLGFVVIVGGVAVGTAILYGADQIDVWLFGR